MAQSDLITTVAAGLGLAFVCGLIANRLRLPLLIGYLAAGLIIGPFTPGYVANKEIAHQLSEIGVSLLMFGVGLHFSIRDLLAVRKIAIPGALVQIITATILGAVAASLWGWTLQAGLVFGLCLSVASTVVLLRALSDRGEIETVNGRIAVGWLIVEDLVTVIVLVALPVIAGFSQAATSGGGLEVAGALVFTFLKVVAFAAAMLVIGKKLIPLVLGRVARSRSKELFTLGVLATALGIAFGASALFGVSPALGAFFAGVVLSESDLAHQAGAEARPVQDVFTVLFFVSIGMLFNPTVFLTHPLHLIAPLAIVLFGKSAAAFLIVLGFKFPVSTALIISASLAQIGEFSFVLVALGISLGILPAEALSITVATAIISISVNPAMFNGVTPLQRRLMRHPRLRKMLDARAKAAAQSISIDTEAMSDHVVIVGFGGVGSTVAKALVSEQIPFLVIDSDPDIVDVARQQGFNTVFGDASRSEILNHAGMKTARLLVLAIPASSTTADLVASAREINPGLMVCVRTHDAVEAIGIQSLGVGHVVAAELELALQLAHYTVEAYDRSPERLDGAIAGLRSAELGEIARLAEIKRLEKSEG